MESPDKKKEKEFGEILENYAEFLSSHIKKFDLHKYGLDPEDIMQDVRIKIWKLVQDERVIFSHASYLKKIISTSVVDQLRKCRRQDSLFRHERQRHIAELRHSYSQNAAATAIFENTLGKAVERLIDSRRQVVKLYLLSFNIQEISSYFNWSVDRTRNLLYRGLADLRNALKDMDLQHETRK
jgi:RNA polymerase sigma-70 factor (ECF subfamily)